MAANLSDIAVLNLDRARVLCRLIDEAIEDLSAEEIDAFDRLAEECGYVEWMRARIEESKKEHGV